MHYFIQRRFRYHGKLLKSDNEKIRQTTINAAGEIGKFHFEAVQDFFDIGLFDSSSYEKLNNAQVWGDDKLILPL